MKNHVSQYAFIQAAMNPDIDVSVYRNNIIVSLKEALSDGFPAVKSLVGDAFFSAMSDIYIRQNLPKSPILALYGAEFPAFITDFEPAASLPYLTDVARLEFALRRAYHCADSTPVDAQAFANANIFSATLAFAPTVSALRSDYPVTQIRAAAFGGPPPTGGAEDVLITRPDLDPIATPFPSGTVVIIDALQVGLPFGEAIEAGPDGLDLPAFIGALISGGAIIKLEYDNV